MSLPCAFAGETVSELIVPNGDVGFAVTEQSLDVPKNILSVGCLGDDVQHVVAEDGVVAGGRTGGSPVRVVTVATQLITIEAATAAVVEHETHQQPSLLKVAGGQGKGAAGNGGEMCFVVHD